MQGGMKKIAIFGQYLVSRNISNISEITQDRAIFTMEGQYELVRDLSNGAIVGFRLGS